MASGALLQHCAVSTRHCPDVAEWCPAKGLEDLLAYGTYELNEETGVRDGALHLARVLRCAPDEGIGEPGFALDSVAEVSIPGVYDIAWGPVASEASGEETPLLALASADGTLRLFRGGATPEEAACCYLTGGSILTHVAWGAGGPCGLAAVAQDGSAHRLEVREGGVVEPLARRQAHELETWCVEVSMADPNLVLSGADDSMLLGWDIREPPDAAPALCNKRSHGAGVTALACSPWDGHVVATGSYDERVRLFDLRSIREQVAESEALGDGAYHLAWHPRCPGVLAVAAMRSGLPLMRVEGSAVLVWEHYAAEAPEGSHGSLAYGVSWQPASEAGDSYLVASASFYDKSVHLWSVPAAGPLARPDA